MIMKKKVDDIKLLREMIIKNAPEKVILYHGNIDISKGIRFDPGYEGLYASRDIDVASGYAPLDGGYVLKFVLDPKAKVLDLSDPDVMLLYSLNTGLADDYYYPIDGNLYMDEDDNPDPQMVQSYLDDARDSDEYVKFDGQRILKLDVDFVNHLRGGTIFQYDKTFQDKLFEEVKAEGYQAYKIADYHYEAQDQLVYVIIDFSVIKNPQYLTTKEMTENGQLIWKNYVKPKV